MQWAGVLLAFVTFATIGIGHVLVRRLHARYGIRPAMPFFGSGLLVIALSLAAQSYLLSGILGLIAITLLWDGIEIYRQEKRMQRIQPKIRAWMPATQAPRPLVFRYTMPGSA